MTQTFGERKEGLEFPSEMLKASLQVLGVSVFPSFFPNHLSFSLIAISVVQSGRLLLTEGGT